MDKYRICNYSQSAEQLLRHWNKLLATLKAARELETEKPILAASDEEQVVFSNVVFFLS